MKNDRRYLWALHNPNRAPWELEWREGTLRECDEWSSALKPGTVWLVRLTHQPPEQHTKMVRLDD